MSGKELFLVVFFLGLPFVCLAAASLKRCSRLTRRVLVGLAYGIVVFDGGCACALDRIGSATGASSDDSWQPFIAIELGAVFIWSVLIFLAELRREQPRQKE